MDEPPAGYRRWNVDEFERLTEIGLLAMRGYELLDGIVYNTSGFMRRFSLADYQRMVDAGILSWEEHAHLVDGFVVPIHRAWSRQMWARSEATGHLLELLRGHALVSGGGTRIVFDDENVSAPDIAILRTTDDGYSDDWPRTPDVLLTIEVPASPLPLSIEPRRRQHARFGVPELWLLDADTETVILHRAPLESEYTDVAVHSRGETFVSEVLDGRRFAVDALLGPSWRRSEDA